MARQRSCSASRFRVRRQGADEGRRLRRPRGRASRRPNHHHRRGTLDGRSAHGRAAIGTATLERASRNTSSSSCPGHQPAQRRLPTQRPVTIVGPEYINRPDQLAQRDQQPGPAGFGRSRRLTGPSQVGRAWRRRWRASVITDGPEPQAAAGPPAERRSWPNIILERLETVRAPNVAGPTVGLFHGRRVRADDPEPGRCNTNSVHGFTEQAPRALLRLGCQSFAAPNGTSSRT